MLVRVPWREVVTRARRLDDQRAGHHRHALLTARSYLLSRDAVAPVVDEKKAAGRQAVQVKLTFHADRVTLVFNKMTSATPTVAGNSRRLIPSFYANRFRQWTTQELLKSTSRHCFD